jgi:hypothetical protein
MPSNKTNFPLMSMQVNQGFKEILSQPTRWYPPYFDCGIFRCGGNDVIIEWIPLDVENFTLMTSYTRTIKLLMAYLYETYQC